MIQLGWARPTSGSTCKQVTGEDCRPLGGPAVQSANAWWPVDMQPKTRAHITWYSRALMTDVQCDGKKTSQDAGPIPKRCPKVRRAPRPPSPVSALAERLGGREDGWQPGLDDGLRAAANRHPMGGGGCAVLRAATGCPRYAFRTQGFACVRARALLFRLCLYVRACVLILVLRLARTSLWGGGTGQGQREDEM